MRLKRLVLVVRDYVAQYPDPIAVARGAEVLVERDDREFPGWWWCRAADGRAGWVPAELLSSPPAPGTSAQVVADYSARELTVRAGMYLEVLDERAQWIFARTPGAATGWLPASHVDFAAEAPR
jgi:SH3-like domain-containing protein